MTQTAADEGAGPRLSRRKRVLFACLSIAISVVACLLLAEAVLRLFPVSSALYSQPVSEQEPLLRFAPNRPFVHSIGWKFDFVVHGRVNNAGWVNDQDYVRHDPLPLIAVIGDSLIQARMVRSPETVQGRLAAALKGRSRVYSFGTDGAPMSQYLQLARHAVQDYGAQALIINFAVNDFVESHVSHRLDFPFWIYVPDETGTLRLRRFDTPRPPLVRLLRVSALARYVVSNLDGISWYYAARSFAGRLVRGGRLTRGEPAPGAEDWRMGIARSVIEAFLRDLPVMVGLPADRILFTMDGARYPEQAKQLAATFFGKVRREFQEAAVARGYEFIDLDQAFFRRYAQTGERFEFPRDRHWSALGHAVAAEAVMSSRFYKRLFAEDVTAAH